jgi:hypothetical protein
MSADALIDRLVSRWEELRSRGEETSVEELCRDHPELVKPLEEAIARRQADSVEATTKWSSNEFAEDSFRAWARRRGPMRSAGSPLRAAVARTVQ